MKVDRYSLRLFIFRNTESFKGEVKISLAGHWPSLALDAVDMNIRVVRINGGDTDYAYDGKNLIFGSEINGPADLYIEYDAKYSSTLMGLYRAGRSKDSMLTTQFETTGARRVFPCIDNPEFKAEFDLTVITEKSCQVLSNMPVRGETITQDGRIVEFQRTPRMSTYLFYIGVGEFESRSRDYGKVKIYLTTQKGRFRTTEEPIDSAISIMRKLEAYFGMPFMLPKLHLISVPEFSAGAMENWGAITFREDALLMNESTSETSRATIMMVIAHEMAHHWFGDLVTMKWWNDLWLNESFANFMGYKIVDEIHPEFDMWSMYLESETSQSLSGDSLESTHPITSIVNTPEEIEQAFDEITYGKGGAILRMMEYFMGPENFRDGIRDYIRKYSYSNAEGKDLWLELDNHSDVKVSEIMTEWIQRPGHPIITVTGSGDKIILRQSRFLLSGSENEEIMKIPLTIIRKDRIESLVFSTAEMTMGRDGFIKLNRNFSGFYRSLYSDELYSEMMNNVNYLTEYDLWEILNSNFDFMLSGHLSFDKYMDRLNDFLQFDQPLIVRSVTSSLLKLYRLLGENQRIMDIALSYIPLKIERLLADGNLKDPKSRMTLETLATERPFFDRKYANDSLSMMDDLTEILPELRQSVLTSSALVQNDSAILEDLMKRMEAEDDKLRCLTAIAYTRGKENQDRIEKMLSEGTIKNQDLLSLYFPMANHSEGRKYFIHNFKSLYERFRSIFAGTMYIKAFIENILPKLAIENYDMAESIAASLTGPDEIKGATKAREIMRINREFIRRSGGH